MPDPRLQEVEFSGTPNTAQVITGIEVQNANQMVYAALEGINSANTLAGTVNDFLNALPDLNVPDSAGASPLTDGLSSLGNIVGTQMYLGGIGAVSALPPADLLVAAVTMPVIDLAPAYTQNNLGFVWDESLWDLSLLSAVQVKLLSDLANGGYGIEPSDESALWQRAREREQSNGEAAIQDAARQAAARGMQLPPGVLFKQAQAARQTALEKNSSVSRDIAMKRADLYVQNRQFTIEKAIETEHTLVEYVSSYYGRKLDAMKANLDAYRISVEIYSAQVQAYTAKLGAQEANVRMQVEVIDAQVKTNMAAVSKYETTVRAQVEQAQLIVEGFKAQVASSTATSDITLKAQSVRIAAAEARLKEAQYGIQNAMNMNTTKLGALEQAAKLFIEPTGALAGIANAFIASSSSIALAT